MTGDSLGNTGTAQEDHQREMIAGAGWHPDPFALAGERWWDGTRWTSQVRGAPMAEPEAVAAGTDEAAERLRGMPPGWYPWRHQVARWWDGERWGAARRPFAEHVTPGEAERRKRRWVPWRVALVLVLVVVGVILATTLSGGSSQAGYQARVALLCRQAFARERADVLHQSTAAVSARKTRSQAVVVDHLLRTLVQDSAAFDERFQALTPPPSFRAAQQQYLRVERQDRAIYALAIPRLESRSGLKALNTVTPLLARNQVQLQTLLGQLGGPPCSISPVG